VSINSISERINKIYHECRHLKKLNINRRSGLKYEKQFEEFSLKCDKLFDIAFCKCLSFFDCPCVPIKRVPPKEQEFLVDQRLKRKMYIGSIDHTFFQKVEHKRGKVERKGVNQIDKESVEVPSLCDSNPVSASAHESTSSRTHLEKFSQECDRFGFSDRSAAAIGNALLQDVGLISQENKQMVLDRNKVRRERARSRSAESKVTEIRALFFDGKKDRTMTMVDGSRKIVQEEHITLIQEPESVFLGHSAPMNGSSQEIENSFFQLLSPNLNNVLAIGCDGTAINTGSTGGVIARLEARLRHSVHWIICLLHTNELPLRHLFNAIDGKTSGPNCFTGETGKALSNCENLPVVAFESIPVPQIAFDSKQLSNDQSYLLQMTNSIATGCVSSSLSKRFPGNVNHARWLTLANRILRLYVSQTCPSDNLKILTQYVMYVYSPMWFEIKSKPLVQHGAQHFLNLVIRSRFLPSHLLNVVKKCLSRNSYFAHSESIEISLLTANDLPTREKGFEIYKVAVSNVEGLRKFELPTVNFSSNDLIGLLDPKVVWYPSPLLSCYSLSAVEEAVKCNAVATLIQAIPCHSQSVERHVRLVSESALHVCGMSRRNGWIYNTLSSRSRNPAMNTKKDYVV